MKILVVEDDPAIAQTLQLLLLAYNYAVDVAADGETGWHMAEAYKYDLILLDVILPGLDGISLCQQLRKAEYKTPILFLTGQEGGYQRANTSWSIASALNAGADDYVVKPFDTEELLARVQALLRRGQANNQPVLTWGQLSVDPSTCKVVYGTHVLSTTPKEYAILELLLRNPQKALSSRVLIDQVWSSLEFPGEEAVRVHIKEIRRKLTQVNAPKDFIKTVHRVGYQLNPQYSSFLAVQVQQQPTTPHVAELTEVNGELRLTLEALQTARDELERRVAERTAELHESEERFRNMADHAPVMIWVTDPTGSCTYLSQRWYDFSGQTKETGLGFGWLDVLHPDDQENARSAFLAANEHHQAFQLEYRLRRHDGEYRWAIDAASPWFGTDGQFKGYIGSVLDISDRKLAEQKVREQAALLEITSDAISVRDLDQRILYWNQGAAQLYGWQDSEAVGQVAHQLLQVNTAQITEIMQTLLTHGEWRGELHKTTKMGKVVIVETRWTIMRDESNQPKFVLSVDTDITEKKQMEAQFYRAQRLESLGTLASGIAHDLNNVLTPILAIPQLIRLQQPDLNARSQEMLQLIEDGARRGTNLIQQILTFTRGTGGQRYPVQVISVVQEVLNIVQQSFPKTIVICQSIPDPAPWLVAADSTYLHQVLMNLCVNARDAMPDGGVLSLAVEHCFVDQAFAQSNLDAQVGNYVVITITDTGTGIPPEVRDRVFDPFFTTKPPGQGTGLGLATVLGIVKEYGGFLQVLSEVDRGTQMKVFLPILKRTLTPSEPLDSNAERN